MKRKTKSNILNSIGCLLTLAIVIAIFSFVTGWSANRQYEKRVTEEQFTEQDTYKMSVYSEENSDAALKALQAKDIPALSDLMIEKDADVDKLINHVDWTEMNLEKMNTLGGGSYMSEPDDSGRMDFGETYWVKINGKKYIVYIQTICSRYGKANDGIQCIAVTSWEHYDSIDWAWKWQEDKQTLRCGTPYPGWK